MCQLLTLAIFILTVRVACAQTSVSFAKDIQPIFESSCWKCHGAAVQLSSSISALGRRHCPVAFMERASSPGNPQASRLFRMVSGAEKPSMPLDGALKPEQIETVRLWIEQGAPWDAVAPNVAVAAVSRLEEGSVPDEARKYWAFQKPLKRPVPLTNRHPVDAFLEKAMQDRELSRLLAPMLQL